MLVPIVKKDSSCCYHRIVLPLKHMGINMEDYENKSFLQNIVEASVVVYSRDLPFDISELLILKAKYGFKLIVDVDDYWQLYAKHPLYNSWKKNNMEYKIKLSITNADIVTTTTEILASHIRPLNPNVVVIPNAAIIEDIKPKEESDRMRIIYAGGTSHYWDLKTVEGAFDKAARFNLNIKTILAGYQDNPIWNSYTNILSSKKRIPIELRKGLPLDSYMSLYDDADISIAPLLQNEFNSCKSNLKVIEAGSKGIPIICPNIEPYKNDPVLKYGSNNDLFMLLKYCSENKNFVLDKGEKLREYIKDKYNILEINEYRKTIWQ